MAGQEQQNYSSRDEEQDVPDIPLPTPGVPQSSAQTEGLDDLLDEIDGVLESNAEEFVRGFVQKGGQ
ncbi:ubiquitin-like protein Pup [Psychromicrobium silvestre]|uniref:Prokaryotic ubiquitin-like protein Pup n=1 Tax=Psychromicrobium silvestre TaxID=1645614 RepID=A0A7Y9LRH4_9MICC|nr:ubiquitin-like protein Pup [Psychromicrobium silvestre]NYE94261.1 ubiquitin-like protein Pup [Psychromicrobium silvestre]